jgi:RHS repeat-associated protein
MIQIHRLIMLVILSVWSFVVVGQNNYKSVPGDTFGYTMGNFNVTDGGSAIYSIPIQVSPGTAGLEPKLSLVYSSQAGNGIMGLGWSLNGLSIISATSPTLAQDSFVSTDIKDLRYSLEGERMVTLDTKSIDGGDGVEYRTEQNIFSKIVSKGSLGFPSNNIPAYFEMRNNSGIISEYGNSKDSRFGTRASQTPSFWLLNKVIDTKGNYLTIKYENSFPYTGEYYPSQIDYTGNDNNALSPYASVKFYYEVRPDTIYRSYNGGKFITTKRLVAIKCFFRSTIVREYRITYFKTAGQSQIEKIQECGLNGQCLTPTTFEWNNNSKLSFQDVTNNIGIGTYSLSGNTINEEVVSMDINSDGAIDIIKYRKVNGNNLKFYLNRKNSDIKFDSVGSNIPITFDGEITFGDFNGDGKIDITTYSTTGNKIYLNNSEAKVQNLIFSSLNNPLNLGSVKDYTPLIPSDFNADGRTDFLFFDPTTGDNRWFIVDSSKSDYLRFKKFGSNDYASNLINKSLLTNSQAPYFNDFNNDGLTDVLILNRTNGNNSFLKNNGPKNISFTQSPVSLNIGFVDTDYSLSFTDINSDGFSDLLFFKKADGDNRWILNYGDFKFSSIIKDPDNIQKTIIGGNITPIDYNGDGYSDLFYYNELTGENKWLINASNTGLVKFSKIIDSTFNPNNSKGCYVAGSGNFSTKTNFDFALVKRNSSAKIKFLRSNQFYSNTISRIILGNGSEISIQFTTITDDSVYTKYSNSVYPLMDYQGALPVVKRVLTNDGIDGFRGKGYKYAGARFSLDGRGFRGFAEVHTEDEVTGIIQSRYFNRDKDGWKYINSNLVMNETRLGNGILISSTRIKNGLKSYILKKGVYKCHYSFVERNVSYTYDLNGDLIDSTVTRNLSYDEFGNLEKSIIEYGDGYKDSIVNDYYSDEATWITGRLRSSKLYRFSNNQPVVIRSSAFKYDSTMGSWLMIQEISEPDAPDSVKISKQYTYDNYGNILSSSITGWDGSKLVTRKTTSDYDDLGRFIVSIRNAIGHRSYKTYDSLLGHVTSITDPNGLKSIKEYDAFGRIVKEVYADENWKTIDYRKCGNGIACPPRAEFYAYQQSSFAGPKVKFFDILNREIQSEYVGFGGKRVIQENVFDNKGYLIAQSLPYYQDSNVLYIIKEYDLLGRETAIIQPGNKIDSLYYNGRITIAVNAKGQRKTVYKDVKENIVKVTDNLNNEIKYQYDVFGKPTKTIDPNGNTIIIKYDIHGNKTESSDPDMGLYKFKYNSFGELIYQIDPSQNKISFEYDLLGRLIKRTDPDGISEFIFDNKPSGIGLLSSASSYNGYLYELNYDKFGRKTYEKETIDSDVYSFSYTYDTLNRIKELGYPSGYKINHSYDSNGYLTKISDTKTNKILWKANNYNVNNQIDDQQYGNGIITKKYYDQVNQDLIKIYSSNNNNIFQELNYRYDILGNLIERGNNILKRQESFSYDQLNRLIKSKIAAKDSVEVNYDVLGNIVYKSDVGYYTYGSQNNGPHRLLSVTQTAVRCIPSLSIKTRFNSYNKVKEISNDSVKVDIFYNAGQQRSMQKMYQDEALVRKKIYAGRLYEKEFKNNVVKEVNYIFGPEGVVATVDSYNAVIQTTNYWHKDHLGSLVLITNDSAKVAFEANFDAWGKRTDAKYAKISDSLALAFERGFTGHEHYNLFEIIDMNGRLYDPILGRFLSPDPFIQDFSNLQNFNRYSYVLNNPLSYTDPSGYFFKWIANAVSGAFRGITSFYGNIISGIADVTAKAIKESANFVKENWRTLAVVAVAVVATVLTMGMATTVIGAMLSGAAVGFATGVTATLVNGGSFSQAIWAGLKGAAIGAASAGLMKGIEAVASQSGGVINFGLNTLGNGAVSGGAETISGGKFLHGFYSGAISSNLKPGINSMNSGIIKYMSSAAVGGSISAINGEKFANGAVSSAFESMFTDVLTPTPDPVEIESSFEAIDETVQSSAKRDPASSFDAEKMIHDDETHREKSLAVLRQANNTGQSAANFVYRIGFTALGAGSAVALGATFPYIAMGAAVGYGAYFFYNLYILERTSK